MSETNNTAPVSAAESTTQDEALSSKETIQTPSAKRKYSYKADGKDHSEELSDEEITSRLSLAKAAQARMQEASTTKKQMDQLVKMLKEDPMSVLSNDNVMGNKKLREITEQFLLKQIEEESLTPEERLSKEKDRKLTEYERKEKEEMTKREQAQAEQLEKQYVEDFEKTIIEGLSNSNLPKNAFTVKRMAELMQKNLQHGLDLTPQQLAQLVREDLEHEQKSIIGSSSAEQLIAMFGEDIANKIRKHDLSKFQLKNPTPKSNTNSNIEVSKPSRMSSREFTEQLKNKFK